MVDCRAVDRILAERIAQQVEPTSKAKYVAFQTYYDKKQMPEANTPDSSSYVEGLRLDEAMHPLALLTVGMYGNIAAAKRRAGAHGDPVEVRLQEYQVDRQNQPGGKGPPTDWNLYASNEYGFYSNVNPDVDHPRWSQKQERASR